jgi:2-phospho-L-lactate guanylyltransferase
MSLWAVIPVKPLNRAKSRLAEVLSPELRYQFAEIMLRHVLTVVAATPQITGTLVISRDTKALSIARDLGAKTIQESTPSDLNPALERATEVVRLWGAGAALVLPADLPFLTVQDLATIAEMGAFGTVAVIATDRERDGTNAMLLRPAGMIPFTYGSRSFERHVIAAKLAGAEVKFYDAPSVQLDVDVPADLEEYNRIIQAGQYEYLIPFLPDISLQDD